MSVFFLDNINKHAYILNIIPENITVQAVDE